MRGNAYVGFKNAPKFARMSDLADWLRREYRPRCIGPLEDERSARWWAAQVELANRLAETIDPTTGPGDEDS